MSSISYFNNTLTLSKRVESDSSDISTGYLDIEEIIGLNILDTDGKISKNESLTNLLVLMSRVNKVQFHNQ